MAKTYLDKVYDARGVEATRNIYDAWSGSYDAEVGENGYATPERCAEALASVAANRSTPLLDFGCGTGLSGQALASQGFTHLDGIDLSGEMLAQARAKGIYRSLTQIEAGAPLPFEAGAHPLISAIGVIGAGAAPVGVLTQLIDALPNGGHLVFSFNDHTLEDPAFLAAVREAIDAGTVRLDFEEHGTHLPKLNLESTVYVLTRL